MKLLRFEMYGIKNIKDKISLDFSNKILNSKDLKTTKIKAIVGGNATGKSAIIEALNLYKNLKIDTNYLKQNENKRKLIDNINKITNEVYLKAYFEILKDNKYQVFSNLIIIRLNENKIKIVKDENRLIKGRMLDDSISNKVSNFNPFEYFKDLNLNSESFDIIDKNELEDYLKLIDKLKEFIKIFNINLKSITIKKEEIGDKYKIDKIFNYEGYSLAINNESSGIKRLVFLFNELDNLMNGDAIFIDDLDLYLNPLFINKILEFLLEEMNGQLCFTTNNVESLYTLKSHPHSIDFIGETNKLIPWVKNGNYSPRTLYLDGMIQDSPFNFDSSDFYKVFDTKYKDYN